MTYAIETLRAGKCYGHVWALQDCTFRIPPGRIAGLVGPNGAGKTTLINLLVGLIEPTAGRAEVFGLSPRAQPEAVLAKVGYVGQDRPLYLPFPVKDLLTFGRKLNRRWDDALAKRRLDQLRIPLDRPAGKLSGGQRAQVALVMALAKRPDLLILDEPIGSLDPLARHEFLQMLMDSVAENGQTVLMASHQVADLERICDFLIIIAESRLLLADDLERLLDAYRWVTCARDDADRFARDRTIIQATHTGRTSRLLVKARSTDFDAIASIESVSLDDLILAYLALPVTNSVEAAPMQLEAVP